MRKILILLPVLLIGLFIFKNISDDSGCKNFDGGPMIELLDDNLSLQILLSAGDSPLKTPEYKFVGKPDGIAVFNDSKKISTILINHELEGNIGKVRNHGETGAFVSKWMIDRESMQVVSGEDLIKNVFLYDNLSDSYSAVPEKIKRLCSGDMPDQNALLFNDGINYYGTTQKIFFSGEEIHINNSSRHGRAYAHFISGNSYDLPRLGKISFENIVLSPYPQLKTIAILLDDSTNKTYSVADSDIFENININPPSELYVYVGTKTMEDINPVDKAGLNNGALYGLKVKGSCCENRNNGFGDDNYSGEVRFELHNFGDVSKDNDGAWLQEESIRNGVFQFLRIEDGAWSTSKNNEFYFVTTDKFEGNSRLYKIVFDNIENPESGGRIQIVLNGNDLGFKMLDNITMDPWGRVILQEDPGDNERLAKIWIYDTESGKIKLVARVNPKYFTNNTENHNRYFLSINEETSGVVHAFDSLGEGWYLLNVQSHICHNDESVVEHGQLIALYIPRDYF